MGTLDKYVSYKYLSLLFKNYLETVSTLGKVTYLVISSLPCIESFSSLSYTCFLFLFHSLLPNVLIIFRKLSGLLHHLTIFSSSF